MIDGCDTAWIIQCGNREGQVGWPIRMPICKRRAAPTTEAANNLGRRLELSDLSLDDCAFSVDRKEADGVGAGRLATGSTVTEGWRQLRWWRPISDGPA